MRWSFWLAAGVVSTCLQCTPRCGQDCPAKDCRLVAVVRPCIDGANAAVPGTDALCEATWQATLDEEAAVAGALYALETDRDAQLARWVARARETPQGGRIFHYWGELRQRRGDLAGAEAAMQHALALQRDRDPARASNTALFLLELSRSRGPADQSIWLALLAWQQAGRGRAEPMRTCAAFSLLELLLDLGELSTAAALIDQMDRTASPSWQVARDSALARLEAARGRSTTAIALFRRASRVDPSKQQVQVPMLPYDAIELVQALLDDHQVAEARRELGRTTEVVGTSPFSGDNIRARLDAVSAAVELAEGDPDRALATVARGLARRASDVERIRLFNVRGDALMRRGDAIAAEQAWRAAADSVESWRASIPMTQLRGGLVARYRHALASWLDATGARGDVQGALTVVQRMIGRELLDRIYQREADAAVTVDASIEDILNRLGTRRELGVNLAKRARGDLHDLQHDMVAIISGDQAVWTIRHAAGRWDIARAGDRDTVLGWVDSYRSNPDDTAIADRLGAALFPEASLPVRDAPLAVMLDRELADVPLAGLRVGGRYLIERNPILEVLAPDLLFARVPDQAWVDPVAIGDPQGDLAAAASEIRTVARATGAHAYLGAAATRDVIAHSRGVSILHIAMHSSVANGQSAFELSDGELPASEIVARRIAPRLAVIATCRSQIDDDPARSLVAAFLAAGTPAVIGVKRSLDDRDGAALMRDLYRLHGAQDPIVALALAQRAAIAANKPPSAWATVSFFGVGGWIWH